MYFVLKLHSKKSLAQRKLIKHCDGSFGANVPFFFFSTIFTDNVEIFTNRVLLTMSFKCQKKNRQKRRIEKCNSKIEHIQIMKTVRFKVVV